MTTIFAAARAVWARGALNRLAVIAIMMTLLLLALAYWWLGNLPHEIFGTALFIVLARHIDFNRAWFAKLFERRYDLRRSIIVALHVTLAVSTLVVLVTGIVISKSVFSLLPIPDSVPTRDIHWFAAYWMLVIVGVHIGIHWARVMALVRSKLRLSRPNAVRTLMLRLISIAACAFGLWSLPVLNVWTKLTFNFSLDVWNFNASVAPFFAHWLGVVMLPAAMTHYFFAPRSGIGARAPTSRSLL